MKMLKTAKAVINATTTPKRLRTIDLLAYGNYQTASNRFSFVNLTASDVKIYRFRSNMKKAFIAALFLLLSLS
jgi:hypothetical protein